MVRGHSEGWTGVAQGLLGGWVGESPTVDSQHPFLLMSRSLPGFFCVYSFLCVCVREKFTLEQDIGDTEEAIRQKSAEVQVRLAGPQPPQPGLNPELTLH